MILRVFLIVYYAAWIALLPLVLTYLWRRGRRDPLYTAHLAERFGFYGKTGAKGSIWLHAVSLGELRSATGLIRLLLDRGETVLLTHFTPAGRQESARLFAREIASGQVQVVWVPLDMPWCYRRFFRQFRPRIGLTLEVEIWPAMIFTARACGVPLYLCNGQYPTESFRRDKRGLRLRLRVVQGLAGALVKSDVQAARFAEIEVPNITITGELRFDQPIPDAHVRAAQAARSGLLPGREVVTIASGVEGEEALFVDVIRQRQADARAAGQMPPLFVYVPRAPERFDAVAGALMAAGIGHARRSQVFDSQVSGRAPGAQKPLHDADVLLGDSLGEMFFYLALADRVIVGGGFTPRGAHNIIEPLMLGKPVLVGPHVWTIEYPFVEAEQAGVARSVPDAPSLLTELEAPVFADQDRIAAFLAAHGGASLRTLAAVDKVLGGP